MSDRNVVLLSPILVLVVSFLNAWLFGLWLDKWAFVPIMLINWVLWTFFVLRYGGGDGFSVQSSSQKTPRAGSKHFRAGRFIFRFQYL